MSSIREQIMAAAVTALTTDRPAGVPAPVRTRVDPPTSETLPSVSVYQLKDSVASMLPDRANAEYSVGPVVRRTLDFVVEVCTAAGSSTEPDKAADPMLVWASKAITALDVLSMTSPAREIGTEFTYSREGDVPLCRALMSFRVFYDTLSSDPEAIQ